ncbi:MAG: PadR family transcriptional regulator [Candidatus Heteroscillospira sp.]|jgi:DNA-binding PadR family transcriptional regulator
MGAQNNRPMTEAMFYTLMAFQKQEICGTEIAAYVSDRTDGRVRLGPGTLYTILAKFLEEKLITETAVDGRKRTYAITESGREAYKSELARLRQCIFDAEEEEKA